MCPEATQEEMRAVAASSQKAFQSWRETPITVRTRYMFALQSLITKHHVIDLRSLIGKRFRFNRFFFPFPGRYCQAHREGAGQDLQRRPR